MRHLAWISVVSMTVACGGSEPAPTKAPAAEKAPAAAAPAAEKAPEAAPAPAKEEKKAEATPEEAFAALADDQKHDFLMKLGEEVYTTGGSGGIACSTCHMANGEGAPGAFPPLKGAKEWMGDCAKHAGHVINGLNGEIEVNGVKYNGAMPAQANLSDLEIAAVITYERNSWGNDYGDCAPDAVAAAR